MKAVIMAGGAGTRLRPITCNRPKPMIPLLEKPLMEYIIELLKKNGIRDIAVTLHYMPDEIMNYFGDGKSFGVEIRYFLEEYPLGTAGSIKSAENYLNDTFVVISGDALTDVNIQKAVEFHKSKNALATVVLKEVPVPLEYGVVITDNNCRITGFMEKPSWGEVFSDKANTGIYILEPEIFKYYEKNVKFDFSKDLFPILINNSEALYGYIASGYWSDIGSLEQYIDSSMDVLLGRVEVKIKGKRLKEGVWVGDNCDINSSVNIKAPAFIGNNCCIYENAEIGPFCVLGRGNIISNGSIMRKSITFENCYIGGNSQVKGSVLCRKVQMGSRTALFEGSAIGDDTLLGEKVIVKPGVKVWPNKKIGSGTVVHSNVIWGDKTSKSIFGKQGVCGEVNVDITPEFVSKLGSVYGSILKPESKVAISCTDNGASQMYKYSLATGLLSMGMEVYDLKRLTTPMMRQAVAFLGVQGAIHVTVDNENMQRVKLMFMDENGLDIDKDIERKIENGFIREDFRRVKSDYLKRIIDMNDWTEYYTWHLINQLDAEIIRKKRYKVVLSINNPGLISIVEKILSELDVNIRLYQDSKDIVGLKQNVTNIGADMGIYISYEGDKAIIIDNKGNLIRDGLYDALNAMMLLRSSNLNSMAAPVTASLSVEKIAGFCGARFIRAKTSQKSILEAYLKNEVTKNKPEILKAYLTSLDAVSIIALTLNTMATSGQSLENIIEDIPKYFLKRYEVNCPWNMKGRVMRGLIEENNTKPIELIEGIRMKYDNAWALVLPDAEEPICRIYTEAENEEYADFLCDELKQKVESLIKRREVLS